jgi:electron-transferring-flavoprotein dehydrogenase
MDADIVCVGLGPATAGFLTTLTRELVKADGTPAIESVVSPGMPLQVLCYERADDIGFGVSGVVTKARALRASLPEIEKAGIPMMAPVAEERLLYLLDPVGASRRSLALRTADHFIRAFKWELPVEHEALKLPWAPAFLHKRGGLVLSLGQFMQWAGAQVQGTGSVQIWPGAPVSQALTEGDRVVGVRLLDQGVDKAGAPGEGFAPGMDVRAALTVVGDGPVGAVGRQLDARFGMPAEHHARDWAVGMKFVVELPEDTPLEPGTVLHTFGYPEPEIFGFFYVHPERVASLGIFVPSWFDSPIRTAYRYLQHWMLHPYLWRYLKGGSLRSWGAKSLAESGRRGEPHLVGDGYARIGEGSGSTNVLTGSGVDEAWATGAQLAEAVKELLEAKKPFTRQNLEETYVARRRASWVEQEGRVAEKSRDGFQSGVVRGLMGMALAGLSGGRLALSGRLLRPWERIPSLEDYYRGRIPAAEVRKIRDDCYARGASAHAALMDRAGWPAISCDGKLLVSHQDALLMGGKVQAPAGYADHVAFEFPDRCRECGTKICVEACSGQAITPGENGVPNFDREKCVHCGACLWNCASAAPDHPERMAVSFRAGTGGLHSVEN